MSGASLPGIGPLGEEVMIKSSVFNLGTNRLDKVV